jgi:hypothetical protein
MEQLLAVPLCAFLDRLRGDSRGFGGFAEAATMGLILSLLIAPLSWWSLAIAMAWAIGASTGWGTPLSAAIKQEPMGPKFEWWQVGILKRSTYLALTVRGLMWGLPSLLLIAYLPNVWVLTLGMGIAFPLSCYLSTLTPTYSFESSKWNFKGWCPNRWKLAEWLRGGLVALIVIILVTTCGL